MTREWCGQPGVISGDLGSVLAVRSLGRLLSAIVFQVPYTIFSYGCEFRHTGDL